MRVGFGYFSHLLDKQNIWEVNTEDDYHESKEEPAKEEALQETVS